MVRVPAGLGSGEGSLPGLQTVTFSLRPHAWPFLHICSQRQRARSLFLPLLVRPPILLGWDPTFMTSFNLN